MKQYLYPFAEFVAAGGDVDCSFTADEKYVIIVLPSGDELCLWERDLHNLSMAIRNGHFDD